MKALAQRLRDSLTPGQRWTASGAVVLASVMLVFGAPARTVVVPGREEAAAPIATAPTTTAPATPAAGPPPAPAPRPAPARPAVPDAPEAAGGDPPPIDAAASTPTVVALVDPGRGDEPIAAAFLDARDLGSAFVPLDDATCAAVLNRDADVAIAAGEVPTAVRTCLTDAGVTVVANDSLAPPASVGTRWGLERVLGDLGRWGHADALAGRVGVVAPAAAGEAVDRSMEGWRSLGIDVAAVVHADDGDEAEAVLELASHGADVVVLAVPVDVQRRIVPLAAVLLGGARLVVADLFDTGWDEGYPPLADGAVALTAALGPWFTRAHGEVPAQRACLDVSDAGEQQRVLAWCAVTELAARAVAGGVDAITTEAYVSPLTSELVAGDGGFGPAQAAVVTWQASCSCWTEQTPFAPVEA